MQKKLMKQRKEEIELARLKYQKMQEISNKIKSVNLPTTFFSLAPDQKEKEEERQDQLRKMELERAIAPKTTTDHKIDTLIRRYSQVHSRAPNLHLHDVIVKITETNEDSLEGQSKFDSKYIVDTSKSYQLTTSDTQMSDAFHVNQWALSKPLAGSSNTIKVRSSSSSVVKKHQEKLSTGESPKLREGRQKSSPPRLNLHKAKISRRLTVVLKRGFSLSPKISGLKDMVEDFSGLPQDISKNYRGMRKPQKQIKGMNLCRKSSRISTDSGVEGKPSPKSPLRSETIFSDISFDSESETIIGNQRKNFVKVIQQFFFHLQNGHLKQVKQLVKISRMLIYSQDAAGWSALHHVIRLNNLHFLADLVHLGSQIDLKDNLGRTPLYLACKLNNFKIVEFLLQSGANPSLKANDKTEAIKITTDSKIIKLLAEAKKTQSTRRELFKTRQWKVI